MIGNHKTLPESFVIPKTEKSILDLDKQTVLKIEANSCSIVPCHLVDFFGTFFLLLGSQASESTSGCEASPADDKLLDGSIREPNEFKKALSDDIKASVVDERIAKFEATSDCLSPDPKAKNLLQQVKPTMLLLPFLELPQQSR